LPSRRKSMRAAACATLASILRWERTTPFGEPSEPDVNNTAAQSSGLRGTSGFFQPKKPRSLSAIPIVLVTSSRQTMRTCVSTWETRFSNRPRREKGGGGQVGTDWGGAAGGEAMGGARREVDQCRHASCRHDCEQGDHRRVRGR